MPIIINKADHFFMAIGKDGLHSFVFFGPYNKTGATGLFCKAGTGYKRAGDMQDVWGFWSERVRDRTRDKKKNFFSYQAYDITYSQYCEFVQLLETLEPKSDDTYPYYKPVEEKKDGSVVLALTNDAVFSPREDLKKFEKPIICRHAAIEILEKIQHMPLVRFSSSVSGLFFKELLCTTQWGRYNLTSEIPFYVLPRPPTAYNQLNSARQGILAKLYQRMESMLSINHHSAQTKDKFYSLKDLYNKLVEPQAEPSLNQLLDSIHTWKEANKEHLNVLRKTYFWDTFVTRQSATTKLIHNIEQELHNKQNAPS